MEKIKVGSREFDLRIVEYLHDQYGVLNYDDGIIYIAQTNQMQSTILHELIHALSFMFEMELTEPNIKRLEEGLMMVFRDNPQLRKIFE